MKPSGVGVVFVPTLLPFLREAADALSVIEIEPQTVWRLSRENECVRYALNQGQVEEIAALPYRKLLHSVGMPVGGTHTPESAQIELVKRMAEVFECPWVSDHLSFNTFQDGERSTSAGFFLPPRQTTASVDLAAQNIRHLSLGIGCPIAFETGVNYLQPLRDELSDAQYFARVADAADCGILVDFHNLWVNQSNGRMRAADVLQAIPLDRVWEVHIAGGTHHNNYLLDAHSGAPPDEVWRMAESWIPRMPNLGALIFEISTEHVARLGFEGVAEQLDQMRDLWRLRAPTTEINIARPAAGMRNTALSFNEADEWERTLGKLVIGHDVHTELSSVLSLDPGVALLRGLVSDARAGLVSEGLRNTMTLLLLTIGPPAVTRLLASYAAVRSPELYVSAESDAFATFLAQQSLPVPFLGEVLGFEHALIRAELYGENSTVNFTHDPAALFSSLEQGRMPENLPPIDGMVPVSVQPRN